MKISNHPIGGFRILAVLCALLLMVSMLPMYAVAAPLYEGWYVVGDDNITYDTTTHAITLDGMTSAQHLYLNHPSSSADNINYFGANAMTDFVIEMDVSITDYYNKALADQNPSNSTQAGGAISLVFAGNSDSRLDYECVTFRVDPVNFGVMWRGYSNIQNPYEASWGYAGAVQPWHWRFLSSDIFHIKAVRSGSTVTMTVTDANGTLVNESVTTTLPDTIPAAGYVGLLVESATATVTNVEVTNNTDATSPIRDKFFAAPSVVDGGNFDDWRLVTPLGGTPSAYYGNDTLTLDGTQGVQYLYLNRWDVDNVNSSDYNVSYFNPLSMTDFVVEFDAAVTKYGNKELVESDLATNGGAGYGSFGLAFLGAYGDTLKESAITASITYNMAGLQYAGYPETTPPATDANGYIGNSHDWHWLFLNGQTMHVKVTKSGNTVTMDVNNGYVTRTATLPDGHPTTGYIGLVAENAAVNISGMKVTNTNLAHTVSYFHTHVWNADNTCACGAVLPQLFDYQGTSLNEAGNALRFGFAIKANGITKNGFVRNMEKATIVIAGRNYELVDFGAIISNKANAQLTMEGVDGKYTKNIPAVKLYGLQSNAAAFACGIKNIPATKTNALLYARAYYIYNDGTKNVVVYGEAYQQSIDGHLAL